VDIKQNESLAKYTSWLVGGIADYFAEPSTESELLQALDFAKVQKLPVSILGGGSNVLISDAGVRGLVICLKKFSKVEIKESDSQRLEITALAGTSKSELLKIFLKYKLSPALFLAGLPGDIGGGVVMNAGVAENFSPREFVELVDWIRVLDFSSGTPASKVFQKSELDWSYRHCLGWGPGVIVEVGLSWPLSPKDESVLEKVREANKLRLSKQPLDMPSCGSVFKNPPPETGFKAAQLIDSCGLKGFQIGQAQVSKKHANFIVNLGGATASDIWSLIQHVQKTVKAQKGLDLVTEVVHIGEISQ
jgi:UDP-N-acetylmuramate dehydrogenase